MPEYTACELVRCCSLSRDPVIWEEFVARFGGRIRDGVRRALRRAGLQVVAAELEDLLQNVYCKLLDRERRNLRRCRGEEERAVGSYLGKIAENVTIDHLRAASAAKRGKDRLLRLPAHVDLSLDHRAVDPSLSPEARLLRRERQRVFLRRCRASVGPRYPKRDLLVLYLAFLEGLSSREISERVGRGVTPSCVDSLVHRARKKFAEGGLSIPHRRIG